MRDSREKGAGMRDQDRPFPDPDPRDGNPSSKNLGFVFSNELFRKESEFMTGSIKTCLTLIGYYYYFTTNVIAIVIDVVVSRCYAS